LEWLSILSVNVSAFLRQQRGVFFAVKPGSETPDQQQFVTAMYASLEQEGPLK